MVRLYGNEPYTVVVVHGGPGAIGSLKGFAEFEDSDSFWQMTAFGSVPPRSGILPTCAGICRS